MWYVGSPEKVVSGGLNSHGSLEVMWSNEVRIEPGPAIFYLTSADNATAEMKLEDELLGSAPISGNTGAAATETAGTEETDPLADQFILPDLGKIRYDAKYSNFQLTNTMQTIYLHHLGFFLASNRSIKKIMALYEVKL